MATTKTTKHDVRLIVRFEESSGFGPYLHMRAEVVYFDNDDQRWVYCLGYSTPEKLRGFENLMRPCPGRRLHQDAVRRLRSATTT